MIEGERQMWGLTGRPLLLHKYICISRSILIRI
ncbi:hypothetical protein GcM1_238101 [Golovinomyces cichoracearum]|uniref:Uncharacterized protein n=1 Tax=Golovinomyces cichoracearum TaxID=62708 RepID=A0A420IJF0_9PEZI|nr:hypothetical protein GcM1_238101 [Golovinomyces cichoracearum]